MEELKNNGEEPGRGISMQTTVTYAATLPREGEIHINLRFETEYDKMVFEQAISLLSGTQAGLSMQEGRTAEPISLSPRRLQEIITRWYPAQNERKKMEVVNDILSRVRNHSIGEFYYECRYSKYKLCISGDGSYLYDLIGDKAYCFIK